MHKIEIEFRPDDDRPGWTVRIGDRYDWGLAFDEALGVVATAMVHLCDQGEPGALRYLQTAEQWQAQEDRRNAVRAEREASEQMESPITTNEE